MQLEERCDGKVDCDDGSDEVECRMVLLPVGYNKLLTPLQDQKVLIAATFPKTQRTQGIECFDSRSAFISKQKQYHH